ncbi:hypothetical protein O181_060893 [Austropuccinia psidii MF-1]|uniref:Uncharacterized protein n=1 Tax=Austropuccinia psidii MF-1 TaxID=1389203 RepID=A0A9Q3EH71_9BASI|nr:hypothetical protein [Austropuccinia psidii MF-1]
MVTISTISNALMPSPSFIGGKITLLWSRSEVTIAWWPRRGGGQTNTGGNQDNHVEGFPSACLWSWGPFTLRSSFTLINYKGVLPRVSCAGTPLATWLEGA